MFSLKVFCFSFYGFYLNCFKNVSLSKCRRRQSIDIRVVICINAVAKKTVHRLEELREHMLKALIFDGNLDILSFVIIRKCFNKMVPNHNIAIKHSFSTIHSQSKKHTVQCRHDDTNVCSQIDTGLTPSVFFLSIADF